MDQPILQSADTVILIAEDDAIVRNLISIMLTKAGYLTLTANDGEEALEVCREHEYPIHLLLTDVRMPKMDGLTLAQKVRSELPGIKVVVMSGEMSSVIRKENTFDAFLRKPFVPPTLLRCIERVLTSSFTGICDDVPAV